MPVGIDLGTTFSLVAERRPDGIPRVFPDVRESNQFHTASLIWFDSDGSCTVGSEVMELLDQDPALKFAQFVKLKMGGTAPIFTDAVGRRWLPEGLSALILKKLIRDAAAMSEEPINEAVISVPARFSDRERQATYRAGVLAGLDRVSLVDEPVAAATFYGMARAEKKKTLMVFDLGGGTLDVSILHCDPGALYVVSKAGRHELGGKNFDEVIMRHLAAQFRESTGRDPMASDADRNKLRRHAEEMKIKLSKVPQVRRAISVCGKAEEVLLSRTLFEQLSRELVEECLTVCREALSEAGLSWKSIDNVFMAGGSSLIPCVQQAVQQASGLPSASIHCDRPHEAIAFGAALTSDGAIPRSVDGAEVVVHNVAGYDLGIKVMRNGRLEVDPLIARNAPLPSEKRKTYYTTRPGQAFIDFHVVQVRPDAEVTMGQFKFGPIAHPQPGHPVDLILQYDAMGMVKVQARDLVSGAEMSAEIQDRDASDHALLATQKQMVDSVKLN